ncbi:hypothetical protein E2C01_096649 [Portunus trituberculatus]|uniref:Uncharacterized protein n=1 Tax=Portunus trituberculatus TaxID=210409 RepID=A0A5B7K3C1_PORTR|nr:hypothetical protein [Portunus trituberculatus]
MNESRKSSLTTGRDEVMHARSKFIRGLTMKQNSGGVIAIHDHLITPSASQTASNGECVCCIGWIRGSGGEPFRKPRFTSKPGIVLGSGCYFC